MGAFDILITPGDPPRGGTQADKTPFQAQYIDATQSWGSSPSTATLTYVGDRAPLTLGAFLQLDVGLLRFWGICKSDNVVDGTGGRNRTLMFEDTRRFLHMDPVFGAFNMPDVRIVNGVRTKRYWHIYPRDWASHVKTFTAGPISAAQIISAALGSPTVLSAWAFTGHAALSNPVFRLDAMGGMTLASLLQEVADKIGLVFGVKGGPYSLAFVRKGEGSIAAFPANSDERMVGAALSGHPTEIQVVGERNRYQLMNVELVPNWNRAWEGFIRLEDLDWDIYQRATDPISGRRFNALAGDTEHYVGFQLAAAYARVITVRQYVALRNAVRLTGEPANDGTRFADFAMFARRSRMEMPAALYIQTLLFRAFEPDLDFFPTFYGGSAQMGSVDLVDGLLTLVTHSPATGVMSTVVDELADGNGYAIVKGFNVGGDMFRTVRTDQLKFDFFSTTNAAWQHVPFQIDDSGEGFRFLIFDQPIVVSENLLSNQDGHVVVNAQFNLTVPSARATLVVEAERFHYSAGVPGHAGVENVAGLFGEFVVDNPYDFFSLESEVPFADGGTALGKAAAIAASLLQRQWAYVSGSYKIQGIAGTVLGPMVDRVSVRTGPQGTNETVDYTNERGRDSFEPDRDLDRRTRENSLLPGQAELRAEAEYRRTVAEGFKQNPGLLKSLSQLLNGPIGSGEALNTVIIQGGTAGAKLPVGTVLRKAGTVAGAANTNTQAVMPTAVVPTTHKVFMGVTVRHNEDAGSPMQTQATGVAPVRVQGPVGADDAVGLSTAAPFDVLVKNGTVNVGKALQVIADGSVKVILVRLGSGGGGSQAPTWI